MNKGVLKASVLVLTFVAAVVLFSALTNKTNRDMTAEMKEATLPTIDLYYQEEAINRLYGYVDEMNAVYMRGDITPIEADSLLPISVRCGSYAVDAISYEIRSMDTERLVADAQVSDYQQENGIITADLTIQNLLEENQEYILMITLEHGEEAVRYYSRIIKAPDYHVQDSIEFVKDFHTRSFGEKDYTTLATYMEPDASADNTTLANVSIHSRLKQVGWADFEGTVLTDPTVRIKEIQDSYNVIVLEYVMTSVGAEGRTEYYNVEESYRVRYASNRMYLLNFDRTMDEIFRGENDNFYENFIQLGICSGDVEYVANEVGDIVCFVREGELWCYNAVEKKLSQVFSFRGYEGIDDRENHDEYEIHIIGVDETGSADFVVYGYMNRGQHEGRVGIGVYHYNSVANTVEEELFIPSTHSYEVLKSELGDLVYQNDAGEFYLIRGGSLYEIDLAATQAKTLVEGFDNDSYAVSDSNRYVAYISEGDNVSGTRIQVSNLENDTYFTIDAPAGSFIRPLGFMGEDFIYGEASASDIYTDQAGNIRFLMSHVYIVDTGDEEHGIMKDYSKEGYLISSVEVEGYTITLNRERYNGETYVPVDTDTIMNREGDTMQLVSVHSSYSEQKQTQLQLALEEQEEITSERLLTPRQIVVEEERELALEEPEDEEYYYAYANGRVVASSSGISDVIEAANEQMGIVVGSRQQYIWKRSRKTQQTAITIPSEAEATESIGGALSGMLAVEGIHVDGNGMLAAGNTPRQILKDALPDAVILDLTGSNLEEILYYVNLGTPVFAMSSGSEAVLVVGYDSSTVTLYHPVTGSNSRVSMTDAQNMFDQAGNVYLAYLKH